MWCGRTAKNRRNEPFGRRVFPVFPWEQGLTRGGKACTIKAGTAVSRCPCTTPPLKQEGSKTDFRQFVYPIPHYTP